MRGLPVCTYLGTEYNTTVGFENELDTMIKTHLS